MKFAKVFKLGNSQVLRLPKEFQFHSKEVEIFKRGNEIILREKPKNLKRAFELLSSMPYIDYSVHENAVDYDLHERLQ